MLAAVVLVTAEDMVVEMALLAVQESAVLHSLWGYLKTFELSGGKSETPLFLKLASQWFHWSDMLKVCEHFFYGYNSTQETFVNS